ncbi:sialidase family protein [Amycolatopsis sp., V23-08]|uniref:exo-alpha-sialidase n=1 Tax=Amycolatopsis heterodermiae TaxID=3110235 RepID=A0ABU5R9Z3_9PSEU|nr:sialidase family protein [Amycolatopsis sp., V23-08]MEA5363060.1 sialidase family protein [Amycolatopsis sp., V23-08]
MKFTRIARGLLAGLLGCAAVVAVPASIGTAQADVTSTLVFTKNTEGHDCYRIPTIVKANDGALLAFAEGRNDGASVCNDLGAIDLVMKRSTDGGKTWSALQTVIKANGDTKGNPAPIVIPGSNRVVLLSTMQCYTNPACGRIPRVSLSEDNGKTWGAPRVLTTELGFSAAPSWLATGPSHGIVLTRGAHKGRLVAGMSYSNIGALVYSDDNGSTWHLGATDKPSASTMNPQEISVTELADGRVYAAARNQANDGDKCLADGTHNRAYAISSDGGATFSTKFTFATDLVAPTVEGSTARMSATDTGGKYDRIVFAAPSTCDRRKQLRVHSSFDEGGNWTGTDASLLVWGQDAAYSDMVQLSQSSVGVLFEAGPELHANDTIRFATVTEAALGAPACGGGYGVIDSQPLGTAGTVYLSYNASNGQNCVSTMKSASAGTATATSAFLEVQGAARQTDSGSFSYFAGPVKAAAANKCVKWGGTAGGVSYTSEFEHCG